MKASTRNFSSTTYPKHNPEVATKSLIADGYRQVSNTFRQLARVDITEDELRNFFKEKYFWPDTSSYDRDPGGWQDHYRRGYTKDVIRDVPWEIMRMMRDLIDYRLNCFERRTTQMLYLRDLAVGETFKRPGGTHIYQVTEEREESCGNLRIMCNNLTSGRNYFHGSYVEVIRVPHPGITKAIPRVSHPGSTKRFWMCYVDGKGMPICKHSTLQEAQTEAERLAHKTGRNVFVLQAFKVVVANIPLPPLTWHTTDGS